MMSLLTDRYKKVAGIFVAKLQLTCLASTSTWPCAGYLMAHPSLDWSAVWIAKGALEEQASGAHSLDACAHTNSRLLSAPQPVQ